jgi:hypothetical protein
VSNDIVVHPDPGDTSSGASLPQRYEAARSALAECDRIDECQDWADKAAAMAVYARQAEDKALLDMAKRIHARAVRRCGELLKQIPPSSGGDRGNSATGGRPPLGETRTQVASAAGLSEHQRKTAVRVAAVPAQDFEARVESPQPPSITKLAREGTTPAVRQSAEREPAPRTDVENPTALEAFERFARFCAQNEPTSLARNCRAEDAAQLQRYVARFDHWLERLARNLPG